MEIIHTINYMRSYLNSRDDSKSVGLVPTMGYFHDGHLSLMRQARADNDIVVVSLFVNPIQFGPQEDLQAYPRDLDRDAKLAESVGVDAIFNPSADEMYPKHYSTYVDVENITNTLCGLSRPGHFRGVATVVLKLFNIIRPDKAYFGMKDYQQLRVIQQMTSDLNLDIDVIGLPIRREPDGLAMSSRNTYLSPEERRAALILSKALAFAQKKLSEGCTSALELKSMVEDFIRTEPLADIEYVSIVDHITLEDMVEIKDIALLALAVRIGKTRLIDNTILKK
jgi:pantoate--beta-alanine ligase